jgi:hypothetical protein
MAHVEGSGTALTVPGRKVSGPVPKLNTTLLIEVALVTPGADSVNVPVPSMLGLWTAIDALAFVKGPVPMMRSIGCPPGAAGPAASSNTVEPVKLTPQWVIVVPIGGDETAPPAAISIRVPVAFVSDRADGVFPRTNEMSLTSCPTEVGLLIKLDSATTMLFVLVVMVADALSAPSDPLPDAEARKIAAFAGAAPSKRPAEAITNAERDTVILMSVLQMHRTAPSSSLC